MGDYVGTLRKQSCVSNFIAIQTPGGVFTHTEGVFTHAQME